MEPVRKSRAALACLLALGLVLSGCLSADEEDPDLPGDDPEPEMEYQEPKVDVLEGRIEVSVATPLISFNYGGEYSAPLPGKVENTTGYIVALMWDASGPASETLDLWVRDVTQGVIPPEDPMNAIPEPPLAAATGESPLILELDAEEVPDDVEFNVLVRASSEQPVGAAYDQSFTLAIVRVDGPLVMEATPEPEPGTGFAFE